MASLTTPLEQQVANAKKAYQDADEADADNTMELYDCYQELKQKMLEQQDNQAGGGGSSGGAHWANNDKSEITEPVVVPPAPVVVPPTSPEPSPPPSPKITPKTLPTDAPVWQYGNETIWTLDSAGWQVQADGTHTPHTGSFTKNGDSYIWTDSLGNKWEDMFYDGE